MKLELQDRQQVLAEKVPRAVLDLLLASPSPLRVRTMRDQLALSLGEFTRALRALERHGMVARSKTVPPTEIANQHLYVEATPQAHASLVGGPAPALDEEA